MAILDISTEGTRETVVIDGIEYPLTDFDSFTPRDQFELKAKGERLTELAALDPPTEAQITDLETLCQGMFDRIAGDIPADVREKLSFFARTQITNAYFLAYKAAASPAAKEANTEDGSSANSPSSSDSTEAHPATG